MSLDQQFLSLFNGKDQVSGHAEGYRQAHEWIKEGGNQQRKMFACVIFFEKPVQFLATGRTRVTNKGDGTGVNQDIIRYLPSLTQELKNALPVPRSPEKYGAFIDVNFSKVKRVAMLAIQKQWLNHALVDQWIKGYGGLPTEYNLLAPKWVKMDHDTRLIKQQILEELKSEQSTWENFAL
jgi:hypothetical protein